MLTWRADHVNIIYIGYFVMCKLDWFINAESQSGRQSHIQHKYLEEQNDF